MAGRTLFLLSLAAMFSSSVLAVAQPAASPQAPNAPLPDAPSATSGSKTPAAPADEEQTKRIMGVLPNFRSVSAGANVQKETTRQKLITATEDNFDYTALFFAGFIAADSFVMKSTPEFHQGAAGYARYYWHTVADQSVENYFVELIVPAISHEDSRYFAMGKEGGGLWRRTGYALSRVLVTRTDAGKSVFNYSEITGSAAAVSISNFYYPTKQQTVRNGLRNWGLDITYDSISFEFHEFWPDIRHMIFSRKDNKTFANP
ncbi:MAG: hypothetical protein ABSD70_00415 [Terracidiphilus sp.]|jgi:hypothetical protein